MKVTSASFLFRKLGQTDRQTNQPTTNRQEREFMREITLPNIVVCRQIHMFYVCIQIISNIHHTYTTLYVGIIVINYMNNMITG